MIPPSGFEGLPFHGGTGGEALIISAISLVCGVLSLLFGYRLVKLFIFLAGFAIGAVICNMVLRADVMTTILAGLFSGAIAVALWYVGIFLIGAAFGVILAVALGINVSAVILVSAIVGGILALSIRKLMIILSTSWTGAYILVGLAAPFLRVDNFATIQVLILVVTGFGVYFQYKSSPKEPKKVDGAKPEAD